MSTTFAGMSAVYPSPLYFLLCKAEEEFNEAKSQIYNQRNFRGASSVEEAVNDWAEYILSEVEMQFGHSSLFESVEDEIDGYVRNNLYQAFPDGAFEE